jgi:ribonucleoside-diphosphate reductase alpha chain
MTCELPSHYHNFNLSIGVDADFWEWTNGEGAATWARLQEHAWRCGDPGLWFTDHTNATNPTPHLGDFESVNPCGETPLLSNESCVLGSANLTHYLYFDGHTGTFGLDLQQLIRDIPLYIRALDRMIDVAVYPSEDIEYATKLTRKVGLGMMGLADVLAAHRLPYDSQEGRDYATTLTHLINDVARSSSQALGAELGEAPAFSLPDYVGPLSGHRNAIVTTQAPTGTISLIAGASAGIEPVYAVEAESHRYLDPNDPSAVQVDRIIHPFYGWLKEHGFDSYLGEFQEADTIDWRDHIKMQAAVQEHIENAVSKTINLPSTATPADVGEAYRLAYDLGCKGVTVYVNESKGESPWQRIKETCIECGSDQAYRSEGCVTCPNCGSKCDL